MNTASISQTIEILVAAEHMLKATTTGLFNLRVSLEQALSDRQGTEGSDLIALAGSPIAEPYAVAVNAPVASPNTAVGNRGRDNNQWLYANNWYRKGQLVLAVFQHQIDNNYTLQELRDLFMPSRVFSTSVRGNKVVFKLRDEIRPEEDKRFHAQLIRTKDGALIRVSNQWGMNNFPELLQYLSSTFGFPIQSKEG